ncbi:MAG: membrane protein insertion efficiency factor YidD [Ignavibacteriales bacterium]|nr:membrane protein insertion efficiency factor YidD [Ignavibacteriales bacterium]
MKRFKVGKALSICIYLFLFSSTYNLNAQTDWVKWEGKETFYELLATHHHDYTVDKSSLGMTLLSVMRDTYYFFISDLDGDNCPFEPSCSAFFLQSVKETSIFKGTLMFADRFTRDLNFFKGMNHYLLLSSNKFFDPAYNYTLYSKKIKFYSGRDIEN